MTDWPPKPSVFTPFFRRFTNEAERDIRETRALYDDVRRHTSPDSYETIKEVTEFLKPSPLSPALFDALKATVRLERWIFERPEYDLSRLNVRELVQLRDFLRKQQYFHANRDVVLELLKQGLVRVFCGIDDYLPTLEAPSPFTIPLMYALPIGLLTDQTYSTLLESSYSDRNLFIALTDRMFHNLCDASGINLAQQQKKKPGTPLPKFKHASEQKLPADEVNDAYLSHTPFHALFKTPVPLKFDTATRFNHMHVVGGTGAGKTQLLQSLILHDLKSDDPPALIIIDSQGDLIRNISRLDLFDPDHGKLRDKLVLISPKDIKHPPALNIFDINKSRIDKYDEVVREQVVAGVIQTFDYLFAGLLGADLTAKQGVFFKYLARLMLALPETMGRNATILDMMELMADDTPYRDAMRKLPPIQRTFFERDFNSKTFVQTKEQIRYRLSAIIENPTIARLFTQPEQKVDLFAEINRGSVILVDTAKDFLKGSSSHFGRIFIALVLQAVQERAAIPEAQRRPAFLIVDEAADYFDSNIDDLLTEARKYKLGCVFAHQYLEQATASLKASFSANTSIKFAAGLSTGDARQMAPDMRTTPDFILDQPRLTFAAHIRNVTPTAVSIPIEVGRIEKHPRLSQEQYDRMIARNREKVSLPANPVDASPATMSTPELGTDTAKEW